MSTVKDIGPVSAYALAVKYGYTGTEEEWVNEQEAKRKEAVEAANTATTNASTATQAASQAKTYAATATEASGSAAQSEANAKTYAENAAAIAGADIATQDTAGFMKGGDNYVDEAGTLTLTKTTTDRTLLHSHAGGLRIESVAGESVQESTTGAQLFDKDHVANGQSLSVYDGTLYSDTSSFTTGYINVSSLSKIVTNMASDSAGNIWGAYYDENKAYIGALGLPDTNVDGAKVFSVNTEACYVRIACILTLLDTAIIAFGETLPSYEPYTGAAPSPSPSYPQEIESSVVSEIKVVGKNLIKPILPTCNSSGIKLTNNGDGSFTINGTATANCTFRIEQSSHVGNDNPKTYDGTYRISLRDEKGNENPNGIYIVLTNFETYSYSIHSTLKPTATVKKDNCFIYISVPSGITANNLRVFPQLEEGAELTEWEPYQETTIHLSAPVTLHGIGGEKDKIVKKDGVWGVERNIAEVVFDGSDDEAWVKSTTYSGSFYCGWGTTLLPGIAYAPCLCDCARCVVSQSEYEVGCIFSGNFIALRLTDGSKITTVELHREYLSDNPATVIYQLATPTFEPLSEEDQLLFHNLPTFDTVTYLSTDSTIEPVIEVEYGTSKVGAEGILNVNKLEVSELEKTELEAEIETLKNGHNVLSYSDCSQIPGYTSDMTLMEVIDIMPSNSKLQTDYNAGVYPGFTDLPECARTCIGILYIDKTTNSYLVRVFDVDLNKIYMRSAYPEWIEIAPTVLTTTVEETTE